MKKLVLFLITLISVFNVSVNAQTVTTSTSNLNAWAVSNQQASTAAALTSAAIAALNFPNSAVTVTSGTGVVPNGSNAIMSNTPTSGCNSKFLRTTISITDPLAYNITFGADDMVRVYFNGNVVTLNSGGLSNNSFCQGTNFTNLVRRAWNDPNGQATILTEQNSNGLQFLRCGKNDIVFEVLQVLSTHYIAANLSFTGNPCPKSVNANFNVQTTNNQLTYSPVTPLPLGYTGQWIIETATTLSGPWTNVGVYNSPTPITMKGCRFYRITYRLSSICCDANACRSAIVYYCRKKCSIKGEAPEISDEEALD
jgi:hypothetical protein